MPVKSHSSSRQVRIRRALEELGPTFVKLGQLLATRVDMFPPNWITEFEKLHSQVPAVPYELLHADLVAALKGEPGVVFADFSPVPLAAASIAQVHRATLKDGTPVVVKIRRPGIEGVIRADLRILEHAARLLESEVPDARRYDPVQIVAQFRRSLMRELDLVKEARNIDQFARHFADDPLVKDSQGVLGIHQRTRQRAGGNHRQGWGVAGHAARQRDSTPSCWPSAVPTRCCAWCSSMGISMPTRIRAMCCSCPTTASA
jgi:predicted unusual protein kinase regulating ubiquinone biosynthesis (AarF/ABC1/UbiB family)